MIALPGGSEGKITTEDVFSDQEHSCGAKKSKIVCIYLETMWKDSVQNDDNVCEIWRDITVQSDDFNDSKVGASFEEFRSSTAAKTCISLNMGQSLRQICPFPHR